jgi:hypothetical protein
MKQFEDLNSFLDASTGLNIFCFKEKVELSKFSDDVVFYCFTGESTWVARDTGTSNVAVSTATIVKPAVYMDI